jgi:hypothetical protein
MQHRSYEDLYFYVQDLFDLYIKGLEAWNLNQHYEHYYYSKY